MKDLVLQINEAGFLSTIRQAMRNGHRRLTRNGFVRSLFARQLRFDLSDGFPIPTSKATPFDIVKAELLWFIEAGRKPNLDRGEKYERLSIHRLSEILGRPCGIWNGDANNFANIGRAQFNGDIGRAYGVQWRAWRKFIEIEENGNGQKRYICTTIDQLQNLIDTIKTDPTSRYMRVVAWNPAELDDMALPACHAEFQCWVGPNSVGKMALHMMVTIRSSDLFLGLGFNIPSYALLTHMIAHLCCLEVGELVINLGDYHLYESHLEQATELVSRSPKSCPRLKLVDVESVRCIDDFQMQHIRLEGYDPHPVIKAPALTAPVKK